MTKKHTFYSQILLNDLVFWQFSSIAVYHTLTGKFRKVQIFASGGLEKVCYINFQKTWLLTNWS